MVGAVGALLAVVSCGELHSSPPSDAGADVDSAPDECAYDAGFARALSCPVGNGVACASFEDQSTGDYSAPSESTGLAYIDSPPCTPDHSRGDKVVRVLPAANRPFLQRDFAADGGTVPGPGADIAVRFAMRIDGEVPETPVEILLLQNQSASVNYVALDISKTQVVPHVKSAPTVLGQPFTFEAGRWYCVELDATFKAAGAVSVSVDGDQVVGYTDVDLVGGDAGFTTGPRYVDVGVVTAYTGPDFTLYLDDIASAVGTKSIGCR